VKKRRWKWNYRPGDWIGVPLNGGYALGLIVRMNAQYGQCLGYFFAPVYQALPPVEQLRDLRADQAILIRKFLSADLEDGKWPVLGPHMGWKVEDWPLPEFRHRDLIDGSWRVWRYNDDLVGEGETLRGRLATESEVSQMPDDGTSYSGALQLHLADRLGATAPVDPNDWMKALAMNEPPRHYLYFHDRELAEAAAGAGLELGYKPLVVESADDRLPWLLYLNYPTNAVTEARIEADEPRVRTLAEEWGGQYDGWDRPA
jgi:hypothetical protein